MIIATGKLILLWRLKAFGELLSLLPVRRLGFTATTFYFVVVKFLVNETSKLLLGFK